RGQQASGADVAADAVDQVVRGVALRVEGVGIAEDGLVAVGRGPVELHQRALRQGDVADVHRAGGDAAVGDEGLVDAQDLVDDGVEPCVVDAGPQARLQGGKGGQVVHQDADALRD